MEILTDDELRQFRREVDCQVDAEDLKIFGTLFERKGMAGFSPESRVHGGL